MLFSSLDLGGGGEQHGPRRGEEGAEPDEQTPELRCIRLSEQWRNYEMDSQKRRTRMEFVSCCPGIPKVFYSFSSLRFHLNKGFVGGVAALTLGHGGARMTSKTSFYCVVDRAVVVYGSGGRNQADLGVIGR